MVLASPVRVSVSLLSQLLERERLGELHVSLKPAPVWRDGGAPDIRVELAALGWDRELDRDVVSSLRVLTAPETAYFGWLTHQGVTLSVLAAAVGREAVLAVKDNDIIRLRSVRARDLVHDFVAQLPEVPPGRGLPITVSLSELRATDRRGRVRAPGGVVTRRAGADVLRAQELLGLPTTGSGELYSCAKAPLCYVDTLEGRYVVAGDGGDIVRVGPASIASLVSHLDGLRLGA